MLLMLMRHAPAVMRVPRTALPPPMSVCGTRGSPPGLWGMGTSPLRQHGSHASPDAKEVTVNFVDKEGKTVSVKGHVGENILDVAHANNIDLEGACEASLACSTCHVIVNDDWFDRTGEISDEEFDMLDLAFGLTETSRLGCQVFLSEELDGITVRLPPATRNMAVDGHVPKPH